LRSKIYKFGVVVKINFGIQEAKASSFLIQSIFAEIIFVEFNASKKI